MKMEATIRLINIDSIIPNRFQPRLVFDQDSLQELAESIKVHGVIEPLVLRRVGEKFEIIAGERRCKAASLAGLTAVPAIIADVTDNESAEVAIIENTHRKSMSAIEEAQAYKKLLDRKYVTQDQLAKRLGTSQSNIANKIRLLNLDNNVQQALLKEQISERHARTLLRVTDKMKQVELLNKIIMEKLTVRDLEEKVEEVLGSYKTQALQGGIRNNQNIDVDIDEVLKSSEDIDVDPTIPMYHYDPNANASTEEKKKSLFFNNLENENVNMDSSLAFGFNPFKTAELNSSIDSEDDYDVLEEKFDDLDDQEEEQPVNSDNDYTVLRNSKVKTVFVEKEKEYTNYSEVLEGIKYLANNAKLNGININVEEFDFDSKHQFVIRVDK